MTAWVAMVKVLMAASMTRARMAALSLLGLVAVVVAVAIGQSDPVSATEAGGDLVNLYGLSVLAPVVTLVLASATFGDAVDDATLVYLWLRPVPRWHLAAAAAAAAIVAALPVIAVPLALAALVSGGGGALAAGAVLGSAVAVAGYVGVFVALGLIAKRALTWGIVYILIWEGFIARAGTSSSRFSIQYYARSVLAEVADLTLRLGDAPMGAALAVPLVVLALGVVVTTVRLQRMSVA